jgi:hypothetical protein
MRTGFAIISRCAILPQVKPRAICGMIRANRKDAPHMRLHRHEDVLEAMTEVIDEAFAGEYPLLSRQAAIAALDAMLEAVVRLEVGKDIPNGVPYPALIVKLEPKP